MINVVFVVLHYETLKDTNECIQSLQKCYGEDVNIVVVDNGSRLGKIDQISDRYSQYNNIFFLKSEENLGFSKGNNLGYRFAKYTLNADVIILANNDLLFNQKDFVNIIRMKYNKQKFDVAGPRIVSLVDHKDQNPVPKIYNSIHDVNKRIMKFRILYFLSVFKLDAIVKNMLSTDPYFQKNSKCDEFQLHGACLIFANEYIKKYDGLCPDTFMYGEESILKYIVDCDNMKMDYYDDILVYHKEGSSTQSVWNKAIQRRQFFYKWNIKGCICLKNIMKKNKR